MVGGCSLPWAAIAKSTPSSTDTPGGKFAVIARTSAAGKDFLNSAFIFASTLGSISPAAGAAGSTVLLAVFAIFFIGSGAVLAAGLAAVPAPKFPTAPAHMPVVCAIPGKFAFL